MKDLKPNPLISQWASGTENRITVDQTTRENGVLYKGPVVSNQLNGMAYDIYSSVIYNQFTGGMYNNTLTYNEGQFCTIYWQENASRQKKFLKCICVNKSESGIVATPPIKGAAVTATNGVDLYNGGSLDKDNWAFYEEAPIQTFKVSVPFNASTTNEFSTYELFRLPQEIPLTDAEFKVAAVQKVMEAHVTCLVEKTNIQGADTGYYSFPMDIKATYTLCKMTDPTTSQPFQGYKLSVSQPYIEFNYGNINYTYAPLFYPVNPGTENLLPWLFYGMPWGLAFEASTIADGDTYVRFSAASRGLNSLIIEGVGNIQFNPTVQSLTWTQWFFPVRSYGGTNVLNSVGSIKPYNYCYKESSMDRVGKDYGNFGQLSLMGIAGLIGTGKISWEDNQGMPSPVGWWKLISTLAGNLTEKNIIDTLANISNQFPRIDDGDTSHLVGAVQGDAIRNLRGAFMVYSVSGTAQPLTNPGAFLATPLHGAMLEGPGGGSSWQFNIANGKGDNIPTTDPITGENRPKAVFWDYRLQCF